MSSIKMFLEGDNLCFAKGQIYLCSSSKVSIIDPSSGDEIGCKRGIDGSPHAFHDGHLFCSTIRMSVI